MRTRVILQDNLWFRGAPRYSNYQLNGRWMIPVQPLLGLTASADREAKSQELRWLLEHTGERGQGVVVAQEWIQPGDLVDANLRHVWLPLFERQAPEGRWCIFYDGVLAARQRGLAARARRPDFGREDLFGMWRRDLDYLRPLFRHPRYWRLDGRPVIFSWAAFSLKHAERIFAYARENGLYVLADVLGSRTRPTPANGLTGFTAALPELPRASYRLRKLLPEYRRLYKQLASLEGHDFIPAGSCQYDDSAFVRARGLGEPALRITARHRREVETFLHLALEFSRPIDGARYLVWGTLNNWAEGTTILPTVVRGRKFPGPRIGHYQFGHLQALRRAVFGG